MGRIGRLGITTLSSSALALAVACGDAARGVDDAGGTNADAAGDAAGDAAPDASPASLVPIIGFDAAKYELAEGLAVRGGKAYVGLAPLGAVLEVDPTGTSKPYGSVPAGYDKGYTLGLAFGGDGAGFAVPPHNADAARDALAATATWVSEALDLKLRVALVPIEAIRAEGLDVRIARYAPSPHVSYALFSGGGLAWAEAAMKRGAFAIAPAPAGAHPDLTGLSCRFSEMPAERGLILSLLVVPAAGADDAAFRRLVEDVVALVEASPGAGRPVPVEGPPLRWPSPGADYEARARRGGPLALRRLGVHAWTLFICGLFRFGLSAGGFVPRVYLQQRPTRRDRRCRMTPRIPGLPELPGLPGDDRTRLAAAAAAGTARYGLHRQDAALMTCFTLSVMQPDHFHFIDGARGG